MSYYIIWLFLYAVSMSERNKSVCDFAVWHIVPLIIVEYWRTFFCRVNSTVELETLQFELFLPYSVLQSYVTHMLSGA